MQVAKRDRVKKGKAKADVPGGESATQKHPDEVIFAELKSETSAYFRRTWAEALTRTNVCQRYLREVLHWEGGKPLADDD